MNCIFCKIIKKEESATVLYEDDICLAIATIDPVSKGHTLVIPKKHVQNILDIDDSVLSHIAVVEGTPKLRHLF